MLAIFISLLLTSISVFGLGWIVRKYADVLAVIEVGSVPGERDMEVKNKLVRDRMARKIAASGDTMMLVWEPIQGLLLKLVAPFQNWYEQLLRAKEHQKKQGIARINTAALQGNELEARIVHLLTEAEHFMELEKTQEAEKRYIDIISLVPKDIRAYKGLADLYIAEKEWEQARDILKYESRLLTELVNEPDAAPDAIQRLAQVLYDFAMVQNTLGKEGEALQALKRAQEYDSRNPKILNALVIQFIEMGQRLKAERALSQLQEADTENQKIPEFEAKIKQLSY